MTFDSNKAVEKILGKEIKSDVTSKNKNKTWKCPECGQVVQSQRNPTGDSVFNWSDGHTCKFKEVSDT